MESTEISGTNKNRKVSTRERQTSGKSNNRRTIQGDTTKNTGENASGIESYITANVKHNVAGSSNRPKVTIEYTTAEGVDKPTNRNARVKISNRYGRHAHEHCD